MSRAVLPAAVIGAYFATASIAQDTVQNASFVFNGQEKTVAQASTLDLGLIASLYAQPDDCAGVCLAPAVIATGVKTIIENDVIAFMTNEVAAGTGLLIDGRAPQDRLKGHLPASVSVPSRLISAENPLLNDILVALGASVRNGTLRFDTVMPLVVYDAGPHDTNASDLINALIQQGYPAAAIRHYRGGMLVWSSLGLTTEGTSS